MRALEWYRRYGVQPVTAQDPADHVGLLLIFYSRLLREGAREEVLAAFRRDHLLWIPAFCDCVEAETRHPFYRLLARETKALVVESGAGT